MLFFRKVLRVCVTESKKYIFGGNFFRRTKWKIPDLKKIRRVTTNTMKKVKKSK